MSTNFSIEQCDAVAWLQKQTPGAIDLIVTDPAYESLEKHRAIGTTTRLTNAWFEIFRNERFPDFFAAAHRALVKNAHLYVICDEDTADVVKPMGRAAGFTFWKSIVWDKCKMGMGYHYRNQHEFVLFFEKGKRKLNDLGIPSVLRFDSVRGGYPTEKPDGLLRVLVGQSSLPGELVADPFSGSGSTGRASLLLGRRFTGCDVSAEAVDKARSRLAETPFIERAP
jgi:site-specific DNA-methyltransferase (adenine-specific)